MTASHRSRAATRLALIVVALAAAGCERALGIPEDGGVDGAVAVGDAGAPSALDDLVRACVLAASCGVTARGEHPRVGLCTQAAFSFDGLFPLLPHLLRCAQSLSCEEFIACFGGGLVNEGLALCDVEAHCDGSMLAGNGSARFDCGAIGYTCVSQMGTEHGACCGPGACSTVESRCDGTNLVMCQQSVIETYDCARFGETCELGVCLGAGGVCDESSFPRTCNGSVARYCAGGRVATEDCSTELFETDCVPGGCSLSLTSPECLLGNDDCVGDHIRVCAHSKYADVDCRSLGFSTCRADSSKVAHCIQ